MYRKEGNGDSNSFIRACWVKKRKAFTSTVIRWATAKGCDSKSFANEPAIILADEPTGALDSENSKNIIAALRNACDELGKQL